MEADAKRLAAWRAHLQDEADASFLYGVLAGAEPNSTRKGVYERLAQVELRHVALWQKILRDYGIEAATPPPSLRARLQARVARWFGPSILLGMLLREEGLEVKGYLAMHREEGAPVVAQEAALRLAQESAQHAERLREISGGAGEPWHKIGSGGLLRNIVYGFNDGLTANFGLVAGMVASDNHGIVLLSGVAGMVANALSMGSSGYLAAKSEMEVYAHEIEMEKDEIALMPEVEQEELALIYEAKGIPGDRARQLAAEVMKDPERALQEKVREELGIGEAHSTPMKEAWITGTATAVGSLIPVAPFLLVTGPVAIWTSFTIAMLSHFGVGAVRSIFTGRGVFRSGIDMFIVGLGVAIVGYFIGDVVVRWLGGAG
ncbi:MAG: VIT1/CCC1 transporter family protein [FCB group bacterium]|nr:VIT1/CCC1 transporter family protein [FCB group bacterium]